MWYLERIDDSQSGLHLSKLHTLSIQHERFNYIKSSLTCMVLSLVDQHKPKCYLCENIFENIEELRKHQETEHKDFIEYHQNKHDQSPAPGDVTVF